VDSVEHAVEVTAKDCVVEGLVVDSLIAPVDRDVVSLTVGSKKENIFYNRCNNMLERFCMVCLSGIK
jgi:hypothetical protein